MKKLNFKKNLLALAIAGATGTGVANAAVIDGIKTAGEYFTPGTTLLLGWATEDGEANGEVQGTFSYVVEGGLIYAAFSGPTDFGDNVYGAPSTAADSGWGSGRSFDKLLGSDRLLFGLDLDADGGNDMSVVIDYLAHDNGNGYDKLDIKGSDKGSDGGLVNKPGTYVQGAEDATQNEYRAVFGEHGGSVIQDVATSLEYNLSKGCGDITDSADFSDAGLDSGCSGIFSVEWSMAASAFTDFSVQSIIAPLMHASPSKIDKDSIFEFDPMTAISDSTTVPTTGVPEPATSALLLAGLAALGFGRRAKKSS